MSSDNNISSEQNLANLYEDLGDLQYDFRNFNLNRLIASQVNGKRVLDIGCGNGFLLSMLAREGRNVLGIESNEQMIELAKRLTPGLPVLQGFAEEIDELLPNTIVDVVVMIDVLEHLQDDAGMVQKIYRHLTPGGQLIVIVPAFQYLYGKRDANHGHVRRYSTKFLRERLEPAGFRIVSMRYWNMIGVLPYLIAEKVLKKELQTDLRTNKNPSLVKKSINQLFQWWFWYIENSLSFGFGLSIFCIAEKQVNTIHS